MPHLLFSHVHQFKKNYLMYKPEWTEIWSLLVKPNNVLSEHS